MLVSKDCLALNLVKTVQAADDFIWVSGADAAKLNTIGVGNYINLTISDNRACETVRYDHTTNWAATSSVKQVPVIRDVGSTGRKNFGVGSCVVADWSVTQITEYIEQVTCDSPCIVTAISAIASLSTSSSTAINATDSAVASLSTSSSTAINTTNSAVASLSTVASTAIDTTNSALSSLSTSSSTGLITVSSAVASLSTSSSTAINTANSAIASLSTSASTGLNTTNSAIASLSSSITGAETKINAGTNVAVSGNGPAGDPYVISATDTYVIGSDRYDATTNILYLLLNNGETAPVDMTDVLADFVVTFPGDKFLQGLQSYDPTTNTLTLLMSDGTTVPVDMSDLINDAINSIGVATTSKLGLVYAPIDSAVAVDAQGALTVDCAKLKTQCNLATMDDIPTIPATPVYDFGQQASLNGTILHIANSQNTNAGVDVDLSSLIPSAGNGTYNINQSAWYDGNNSQVSESGVTISSITWPLGGNSTIPDGTQYRIAFSSPPPAPWQLQSQGVEAVNSLPTIDIVGIQQEVIEYLVVTPFHLAWSVPAGTGGARTDITVLGTLSPR